MNTSDLMRVLDGVATPSELDTFNKWLTEREEHRIQYQELLQLWTGAQGSWPLTTNWASLEKIRQAMMSRQVTRKKNQAAVLVFGLVVVLTSAIWMADRRTISPGMENLTFNDVALTELTATLEQKFRARITISMVDINQCRFTGAFYKTTTLEDIMETVAYSLNITVERMVEGGFVLKGTGC